ncbi:hypothetical protein ACFL0Q_09160, partial [Thermodesulfobacteriota bacterium]
MQYLNIFFQDYCGHSQIYEAVSDLILVGEWVFGKALFGEEWAESKRASFDALDAPLLPDGFRARGAREALTRLRDLAETFLSECLDAIRWDEYSIVGFTSVYSQHVPSLSLARLVKEHFSGTITAFGGANCQEVMGRTLLKLFPFV